MKRVLLALSPVFCVILLATEEHIRGNAQLAATKHRLSTQGERLDPRQLAPSFTALSRSNATALLDWINDRTNQLDFPQMMRLVAPGKARMLWQQPELQDDWVTNTWAAFAAQTAPIRERLPQIDSFLENPSFDFGFIYGPDSYRGEATYLSPIKKMARLTQAAVLHELHQGNREAALRHIKQILAEADTLKNERLLIGQAVRFSMAQMAFNATWEALQAPGWTDAELAELQDAWNQMTLVVEIVPAVEMERATMLATLDKLREGDPEMIHDLFAPSTCGIGDPDFKPPGHLDEFWAVHVVGATWRFTYCGQAENFFLNFSQKMVVNCRQAATKRNAGELIPLIAEYEALFSVENPLDQLRYSLTKLLLGSWFKLEKKAFYAETEKGLACTAIALKRHALRHGQAAPDLAALVPEFLPAVPTDSMNGKPLNYRLHPDGTWLLYSVGDNGQDDGGNPASEFSSSTYFHLWSSKDAVWPTPATAAEIEKFERKQAQRQDELLRSPGYVL